MPGQRGEWMNFFKHALKMSLLAAACCLLFPVRVYSYIDPGTGSYIFQIVIAAFVAVSFAVKVYWHKIKTFLAKLFAKKEK
jgi:hypothetical protein